MLRRHRDRRLRPRPRAGGGAWRRRHGRMLDEPEPRMCEFARAQGCTLIMGRGRKGWERATRERGYRFGYVTMVKSLP
jgi:hypothetical protein